MCTEVFGRGCVADRFDHSPERAAGLKHDERLSDIWALGVRFVSLSPRGHMSDELVRQVTMYEIVIGRTPFEETDFEEFLTEEALAVYRTSLK